MEAGGSQIKGHLCLHREFKTCWERESVRERAEEGGVKNHMIELQGSPSQSVGHDPFAKSPKMFTLRFIHNSNKMTVMT